MMIASVLKEREMKCSFIEMLVVVEMIQYCVNDVLLFLAIDTLF